MAYTVAKKKQRITPGWYGGEKKQVDDFTVIIDSPRYLTPDTSTMDFTVDINKIGAKNHATDGRGRFNFTSADAWFVALVHLELRNNFETFWTIDNATNYSLAFFMMQIEMSNGSINFQPHHLPHTLFNKEIILKYIRQTLAADFIRPEYRKQLPHQLDGGINLLGNIFMMNMFYPHIDSASDRIYLEVPQKSTSSGQQPSSFKTVIDKAVDASLGNFKALTIWFSDELIHFLGPFDESDWKPKSFTHPYTVHGDRSYKITMQYLETEKVHWLKAKKPNIPNKRKAFYVTSDLTLNDSNEMYSYGTLCTGRIRDCTEGYIIIKPSRPIWHQVDNLDREKFTIRTVDEDGNLMAYKGGAMSLTLQFTNNNTNNNKQDANQQ